MGVKTITITEEAYQLLSKEKGSSESFSEVIKRLAKERGSLKDSLGAWRMSDQEEQEIFSGLQTIWKRTTLGIQGKRKRY